MTNNNPQTPQDTQADLPGKITGTGFHIPITRRDPKNPNGPPIPILTADAQSGTLQNEGDNPATFLEGVRARLFRNGKPAADLFAPQMTYDRSKKTVIATGGVKLVSLPTPSQTTVTADQMTWDTSTSHIVAVGHAFATTHQNGTDIQQSGGRITIDMARKPYEITIGD
ncbi:MAG TPA: hypothetical protein VFA07_13120 [Chthonomonadaceae bacterium]|nr:hypothetical protein [Chthonomonadaceae bacterium]